MTPPARSPALRVVPISVYDANGYVDEVHRHHDPVTGAIWAIAAAQGDRICGVAIIGRPVARGLACGWEKVDGKTRPGWSVEVNRVATDGTRNACSLLYGAARRGALDRGFVYGCTYTLATEPGSSLLASGWRRAADVKGREWGCDSRGREEGGEVQCTDKIRWEFGARPGESVPRVVLAKRIASSQLTLDDLLEAS